MATDYEGSVEQVHEALRDEQYWLARLADSGADDASLDSMRLDDQGGVAVATTQILRADRLPGIVTQFHRGDLAIQRVESWTGLVDGTAKAAVTGAMDTLLRQIFTRAWLFVPRWRCASRWSAARWRPSSATSWWSC
jgi:hypothetical protein